jgi:hypothetical protein
MIDLLEELKQTLQNELDYEIKLMGNSYEKDELINHGATIYTLHKVLKIISVLKGETEDV